MAIEHPSADEGLSAAAFAAAMAQFRIPEGARITVAVSGGADSMALALLLADWAEARKVSLYALTVDHRLRDAAAAEAERVGRWLAARNISHTTLPWKEGFDLRETDASPQRAAREARYQIMADWCVKNDCAHLFVAHHADDQVETFLMRLARGSGVDGLAAMSPTTLLGSVSLLRPLLGFTKKQLTDVCVRFAQDWLEDPSNENDSSTRVRFRKAQEMLEKEGLTRRRLLATVGHLQRAKAALDHAVAQFLKAASSLDNVGVVRLAVQEMMDVPEEVGLRGLSRILIAVSGSIYGPRFDNLEGLYSRIVSGPWRDATLHGCIIGREGTDLVVCREAAQIKSDQTITVDKDVVWDARFRINFGPRELPDPYKTFTLSPLTTSAWRTLRDENAALPLENLPVRVRETLPAIFDSKGLVGVPHAGYVRGDAKNLLRPEVELSSVFRSSLPIRHVSEKISQPKK